MKAALYLSVYDSYSHQVFLQDWSCSVQPRCFNQSCFGRHYERFPKLLFTFQVSQNSFYMPWLQVKPCFFAMTYAKGLHAQNVVRPPVALFSLYFLAYPMP